MTFAQAMTSTMSAAANSTASGRVVARLAPPHQAAGDTYENLSDVYRLAFSPDGKVLAILPGQGPARLRAFPQRTVRS